ncbi:MAG TPA: SprT family zinc-dependent metalloprotease [Nitrososphaeraceae archaeon]|nr:SprT family zinc-dependent metalloprotease [Nitrososphaeraceae archaeon]
MIYQKDRVKYGTIIIPYQIIKTRRIKTSEVIIDANTVTVRTPYGKDNIEIQRLVLDKAKWIMRKQKEYREIVPQITKPSFKENTNLPYLGKNYSVQINRKQAKISMEIVDGKFLVQIKTAKISRSALKELYENWLIEKARSIFEDKVKNYSKMMGVRVKRVTIKKLRNRWGNLTKRSTININLNLIKAPEDIIDYIIFHELCHLMVEGHSHHYWDLLHRFMPDYQDKVEWLKVNGNNLL